MCTNFKDIKTFYIGIFLDTEASEARSSYTAVNTAHHDQFLPSYTSHIILPSIVLVSDSFTKYVNIAQILHLRIPTGINVCIVTDKISWRRMRRRKGLQLI